MFGHHSAGLLILNQNTIAVIEYIRFNIQHNSIDYSNKKLQLHDPQPKGGKIRACTAARKVPYLYHVPLYKRQDANQQKIEAKTSKESRSHLIPNTWFKSSNL